MCVRCVHCVHAVLHSWRHLTWGRGRGASPDRSQCRVHRWLSLPFVCSGSLDWVLPSRIPHAAPSRGWRRWEGLILSYLHWKSGICTRRTFTLRGCQLLGSRGSHSHSLGTRLVMDISLGFHA